MALPVFQDNGDLPIAVHAATLREVMARLGKGTPKRQVVALRLQRIYDLARATGQLLKFIVFGSFVTAKLEPNDVDVIMIMADEFDSDSLQGETKTLFDHQAADAHFGASVFWLRRMAIFGDEGIAIERWQVKRDGAKRGIVEIVPETP